PPQVMALTVDRQEYLVQVPFIARLRSASAQPIGVILPEFATPLADRFVGHVDAAFQQEFLHVAVAQGKAVVKPDPMADDLAWKAVVFVTIGVSRWGHVGCLSWNSMGTACRIVRGLCTG